MKYILGISCFYHDSAAALLIDGEIVAAAQEERFTRKKHDAGFPTYAIKYCLEEAGLAISDVDAVVYYDKPFIKFERLLETYIAFAPRGLKSFLKAMPVWLKEKLYLKSLIRKELSSLAKAGKQEIPELLYNEHHLSHAASAFYPSPFDEAVVLCLDGVGEWATSSAWHGHGKELDPLWQIDFPHSLGLLYSAFTYFTGFKVNSGEYKLMGLATYGKPVYADVIRENLIDIKPDGSFRLDMQYFDFATGLRMTNQRFADLFDGPRREPESDLTQREMDIASSIQLVTEEILLKLCRTLYDETGIRYLCLAGGVALNCVANGKLLEENIFDDIWIQPAAGDAGGALGAALSAWHEYFEQPRHIRDHKADCMQGSYLGPAFSDEQVMDYLQSQNAPYQQLTDDQLYETISALLADEAVIGWFQGRMEFGPRALGNRSIIGDPRSSQMQSVMNLKIKYRESFRPFAPAILREKLSDFFELDHDSPYMLIVSKVLESRRTPLRAEEEGLFGIEKLNVQRSEIPAITHVDYSARIQTVHRQTNPKFHHLLESFDENTGCPVLVNTSFNVRGEPVVCTPEDAYRCFMRTEMDYLVMGNILVDKRLQPETKDPDWQREYELD